MPRFTKGFVVSIALVALLAFAAGAMMVHGRFLPYRLIISSPLLASLVSSLKGYDPAQKTEREISVDQPVDENAIMHSVMFTNDLVAPDRQKLKPIRTLDELKGLVDSWIIDPTAISSYNDQISQLESSLIEPDLAELSYWLYRPQRSYAFFLAAANRPAGCAVLIIPGSGVDEEWAMMYGNQENYQRNILAITRPHCDSYLLVKRGESLMAIHNGRNKASQRTYLNYLINRGGSYSAIYLADAIAWVKKLKSDYRRVGVAGLSQGGFAALLVSMFAQPSDAIIASGYSFILEKTEYGTPDQIVAPQLYRYYRPQAVKDWLGKTKTRVLFTYGLSERGGFYGLEAEHMTTCKELRPFANVECVAQPGAHVYWEPAISKFIQSMTHEGKM